MRRNPKGLHFERWRCDRGCGKWFHAARDTMTMEFKAYLRHHASSRRAELMRAAGGEWAAVFRRQAPARTADGARPYRASAGTGARAADRPHTPPRLHLRRQADDRPSPAIRLLRRCSPMGRGSWGAASNITGRAAQWGSAAEEMNALVGVGRRPKTGAESRAQRRSSSMMASSAVSQNRWPSLAFDLSAASGESVAALAGGLLLQDVHVAAEPSGSGLYEPTDPPRGRARAGGARSATPILTSIFTSIATCWSPAAALPALRPRKPRARPVPR